MRMIKIFLTLLLLSGIVPGCTNSPSGSNQDLKASTCVGVVIKMDDSLGTIRNHACETATLSQSITSYVAGIEKLDFTKCSPAFKTAFNIHQKAWIDFTALSDKDTTMRGEMHDLFDRLEKSKDSVQFKVLSKKIWDTWAEIEKLIK